MVNVKDTWYHVLIELWKSGHSHYQPPQTYLPLSLTITYEYFSQVATSFAGRSSVLRRPVYGVAVCIATTASPTDTGWLIGLLPRTNTTTNLQAATKF